MTMAALAGAATPRPQGPCDIYASARTSCVAAHSTTRAGGYANPAAQDASGLAEPLIVGDGAKIAQMAQFHILDSIGFSDRVNLN
jgi:hypothetical protein